MPRTPSSGLRARYRNQLTPQDVGERVTVRHRMHATEADPRPSDVVGRLLAHDDEVLIIVDRHEQLHIIGVPSVLSAKVVPPHPTRPPEPMVGTEDAPLKREAGRVLLLDPNDHVLLVAHVAQVDRRVWTAPGGGIGRGEEHIDAAKRELIEELGLDLPIGPWVWTRHVRFPFRGVWLEQRERWYLTRSDVWDPSEAPLDDPNIDEARWFSVEELHDPDLILAPAALPEHLQTLLDKGVPDEPVDVGE